MAMRRQMYQIILYDLEQIENIISIFDNKVSDEVQRYIGYQYAWSLHDKDLDSNGQIKKAHFHLVLKFKVQIPIDELFSVIKDFLPNHIEEDINKANGGAWAYLIHANDLKKFQYNFNDIYSNIDRETLYDYVESHRKCPAEQVMSSKAKKLVILIDEHQEIDTFRKLVNFLVYDEPNDMLLGWCAKNTYFVNTMLGGNLKKNKGDNYD